MAINKNTVRHVYFSARYPPIGAEPIEHNKPKNQIIVINFVNFSLSYRSRATALAKIRPDAIDKPWKKRKKIRVSTFCIKPEPTAVMV